MPHDSAGQAGANQMDEALRQAERVIGDWDQRGGLSNRQLAQRLRAIFAGSEQK